MDGPRAKSGSITFGDKLWINGGKNESAFSGDVPTLESSFFILENGTTQEGMKIAMEDIYFSCMTQLENGKVFIVPANGDDMIEHTLIVDPFTQEISSGPALPRKTYKCETISFKSPAHGGRHVVAMLSYGQDANSSRSAFFDILDYTMDTPIWENLEGIDTIPYLLEIKTFHFLTGQIFLTDYFDHFFI